MWKSEFLEKVENTGLFLKIMYNNCNFKKGVHIMLNDRFNLNSYDYFLPSSLIAQSPSKKRDRSHLLVLDKNSGVIEHKVFKDIIDYIDKNSVLVLNNTKVLPSRIYGIKSESGAKIEVLLLKEINENIWECLVKPQKRIKENSIIEFGNNLSGQVIKLYKDGITHIKMNYEGIFTQILESIGALPLPPYIHKKLKDNTRYQTVYASTLGSAAAPTAGLHFTEELLNKIKGKGVEILYVTLHIGLGTFKSVSSADIRGHQMHSEYYEISEQVAKSLNNAKENNKKIVCVGTTSVRTLESNYNKYNKFFSTKEETDIFIYPGYEFKAVSELITNFHLPKSTLIMLVSAFAGKTNIMNAYKEAIEKEYRFFSFGDAMYIKEGGMNNEKN